MDNDPADRRAPSDRVFVLDADGFAIYYLTTDRQIVSRLVVQDGQPRAGGKRSDCGRDDV